MLRTSHGSILDCRSDWNGRGRIGIFNIHVLTQIHMSFNRKIVIFCFLVFVCLPVVAWWQYRRLHPHYVPLPPRQEVTLTIIPGWTLRQVANYLVEQGLASSTEEVMVLTGEPAVVRNRRAGPPPDLVPELTVFARKPPTVSYEGYLAPETYRVFKDATLQSIVKKFMEQRWQELQEVTIANSNPMDRIFANKENIPRPTVHDFITMASIVEREARTPADKKMVADIMWRRVAAGVALQVDSSVHYAINKTGDVFTTDQEREVDSPWNTYKYPGLPPGPICNPGLPSIKAALYPQKNEYWYFLSGRDGKVHYGKTLEEHNRNKKYL